MISMLRLVRGEIRKLTTTNLPGGFLVVLVVVAGLDAAIVAFATDMDGSKTFISTAADQRSLVAFASNAMMITSLFGAIAAAREYGHRTVVPMFLTSPNRTRAVLAQLTAVFAGGAVLAFLGQSLVVAGVALALPTTEYDFLLTSGDLIRLCGATTFAGGIGAVFGAGLGALSRNIGGAVTTVFLALFVIPPLVVQMFSEAGSWIPISLYAVLSGVSSEVSVWAAFAALSAWALLPAITALVVVQRRDVV